MLHTLRGRQSSLRRPSGELMLIPYMIPSGEGTVKQENPFVDIATIHITWVPFGEGFIREIHRCRYFGALRGKRKKRKITYSTQIP